MAHIDQGVVDSNELSHRDDDPGAYPFPCRPPYTGKRLDTVPTNLRWWATQAHLAKNSWYPTYIKAHRRYEELLLQTPEAYPFPFGEHEGKRLDEVPDHLIWQGIHPSRSGNTWYQNLAEANRLYLDKVYSQKSPGSVTIWFGKQCRGYRLDHAYQRRGFIRFCLKPELNRCSWYYKFEDLVRRYRIHLQTHRRPYQPRAPADVENPTGELLGKRDDGRGSVEPDEDYERDGFVVDDEETYEEDGSDFEPADSTNDSTVDDDSDGHDEEEHAISESTENSDTDGPITQVEGLSPSHARVNNSQTSGRDSDDDVPLDELRKKTIIRRLSEERNTKVTSLNDRRRSYHSSSGEETDTADQPPQKRSRRRSEHEVHKSAQTDSHFDAESAGLDEPETPHSHQLSQSLSVLSLSQESAGSPDNDELPRVPRKSLRLQGMSVQRDDDSDTPEYDTYMNTPTRLGRRYRALVHSDVEE